MRKILLMTMSVLIGVTTSHGQDVAGKKTMKECVDVALENNLRIKRSVYNVESFRVNLLQAKGNFLPTLNLNGSYGQNYGRSLNPVSNQFVNRDANTINTQASSGLTVFNGLRIQNTFSQNKRDVESADKDLQKAKNDVIINVVTLYTNVIFNQELFENAKYQLNSSEQVLDRIKKQVVAGAVARTNQLNQEAQVATNEMNAINQENALNLSILQLKQAMQIPASEPLQVVVPELQLEDLILDQNAESVYQMALATMPEIRSAWLKLESAEYALKASRGNYYPRLSLNASATSNYSSLTSKDKQVGDGNFTAGPIPVGVTASGIDVFPYQQGFVVIPEKYKTNDQLKDNVFKTLSLQLSIPILNGFQTRTNVQRSIINKEIADITIKETQNTLRQSIETAYNDAVSASRSYASSVKQVNAQQEAYRMNKQRLEVGALNIIEYQVSENDLFRAKSDLTRAKYNFIFKKKILDFYQGKNIEY